MYAESVVNGLDVVGGCRVLVNKVQACYRFEVDSLCLDVRPLILHDDHGTVYALGLTQNCSLEESFNDTCHQEFLEAQWDLHFDCAVISREGH